MTARERANLRWGMTDSEPRNIFGATPHEELIATEAVSGGTVEEIAERANQDAKTTHDYLEFLVGIGALVTDGKSYHLPGQVGLSVPCAPPWPTAWSS